jgi:cation diffusion facilitator CzcD-associated flavoprotein CzcO
MFVLGFRHARAMRLPARIARAHLHRQVRNPELRAKLTPDYTIGCKRILISDDYYPALTQPNVELVTAPIREVRPSSIVDGNGVEREVDTIIFGTGFHVTDMAAGERIRGRDGALLAERWAGSPQAHRGTTVADFPNLFMLVGPNTGLGHTSMVFMIESQVAYVMESLRFMERSGMATVEVRPEAQADFNDRLQREMRGTVWTSGGCASWYLDQSGKNTTLWPGFTWRFRRETRRFDPGEYVVRRAAPQRETVRV